MTRLSFSLIVCLFACDIFSDVLPRIVEAAEPIALSPDAQVDELVRTGNEFMRQREYEEAVQNFRDAVELAPDNAKCLLILGTACRLAGSLDDAVATLNASIQQKATYNAHLQRGLACAMLEKYTEAKKDLTVAITLQPNSARAHYNRGIVSRRLHDFQDAQDDFEKAIELRPDYWGGFNGLGFLQATCPDSSCRSGAEAVKNSTRACELTSFVNPDLLDTLAASYAEAGQFDLAIKWQNEAIKSASESKQEAFVKHLKLYQQGSSLRAD